jgi:hypothetical protein
MDATSTKIGLPTKYGLGAMPPNSSLKITKWRNIFQKEWFFLNGLKM